ncbi:MAG: DUF4124 domain-containing protein [Cocleimonas sp.]
MKTLCKCLSISLLTVLLSVIQNADAAIYKCVNAEGKTYYNDKACPQSDKETQLENVKDPAGGYIPPAFVEDDKQMKSKGVVVGGSTDSNDNNETSKDLSKDENLSSFNGGASSSASNENSADTGTENIIESIYSKTSIKRTKQNIATNKPLPRVPLKSETVTLEHKSKLN